MDTNIYSASSASFVMSEQPRTALSPTGLGKTLQTINIHGATMDEATQQAARMLMKHYRAIAAGLVATPPQDVDA